MKCFFQQISVCDGSLSGRSSSDRLIKTHFTRSQLFCCWSGADVRSEVRYRIQTESTFSCDHHDSQSERDDIYELWRTEEPLTGFRVFKFIYINTHSFLLYRHTNTQKNNCMSNRKMYTIKRFQYFEACVI